MAKKPGVGWGVLKILGLVYTILGAVFLAVGLLVLALTPPPLGLIFAAIGGVFLPLGLVFLGIELAADRRRKKLVAEGRYVWAEVVNCVVNFQVTYGTGHPSYLMACYRSPDGKQHLFRSQNIKACPGKDLLGKQVKVYWDPEKPKHYYVDTAPLLENYIVHN